MAHPGNERRSLEKIAIRLKEKFELIGIDVQILDFLIDGSGVVFWLSFRHQGIIDVHLDKYSTRLKSAVISHVDDSDKVNQIRKLDKLDSIWYSCLQRALSRFLPCLGSKSIA